MYALIDCNSFFASVEKAFHPGLRGKPVCVLSSNDGCIVALTPEAKAAGLHRGEPIFKCREAVERHHVKVFSTNMMLYAAMSKRVTGIIRQSIEQVENYSIDESFCNLDGYERHYDIEDYMRQVAQRITTWTDIPVSVGRRSLEKLHSLGAISSDACVQQKLFDPIGNRPERQDLSRTVDMLNQRYGLKTVSLAVEGESVQPWKVHCDHKTPNYLTNIREILTVRI